MTDGTPPPDRPPLRAFAPPFAAPRGLAPSAWFLGPRAENEAFLAELVSDALAAHAQARRDYSDIGDDPEFVRPEDPDAPDPARVATRAALKQNLARLTDALRGSIPLASYRNQSHMYWDTSLPGTAGYIAAMLYNQNNVAAEASPVTTALEIGVAEDLCEMLGFGAANGRPPWGHITCDGSVANAEALWMARNLRYQGPAVAAALRHEAALEDARGVTVVTGTGRRAKLLDLSPWELVNLPVDQLLALPQRVIDTGGLDEAAALAAIDRWTVQSLGLAEAHWRLLSAEGPPTPAVIVPATAHYSWPKAAAILGMGKAAVELVPVDLDGRMHLPSLRARLDACLAAHRPVLSVVAVMGTTEESAVDPLAGILEIRDEYLELGLGFAVHADAAWGGYFAACLRPARRNAPPDSEAHGFDPMPGAAMSPYVAHQFEVLGGVDSITVDPHKAGYMPYPAGALCYRNAAMASLVAYRAPVVFHAGDVPSVGTYGIEGSKPGAAPAGVALSHATIPTDQSGFGRLLGRCLFNAKRFYAAVVTMPRPDDPFVVAPFNRLPAEKAGATPAEVEAQRARIGRDIAGWSNAELVHHLQRDPDLMELFRSLGPDLSVMGYAFNFRIGDRLNTDQALMNEMNDAIFAALSIQAAHPGELPTARMFVTATRLDPSADGGALVSAFCARAGAAHRPGLGLSMLISTMQNPWVTQTARGNFLPELMEVLRETAAQAAADIVARHGLT